MEGFRGKLVVPAGQVRTWWELISAALDQRVYSADATLNAKMRQQMKDRFRAAPIFIRRFFPSANIFLVDAYKGNTNGVINQAAWNIAADITDAGTGNGALYVGAAAYDRLGRVGSASEAVYAAAETTIEVDIEMASVK